MGDIKKMQIKPLVMKTTISEVKNMLDGITNELDITEENISELDDIALETIENESGKKNLKRTSVSYETAYEMHDVIVSRVFKEEEWGFKQYLNR